MRTRMPLERREFIRITGGTLGLLAVAPTVSSTMPEKTGGNLRPGKREPAQFKKLLDQMEAGASQFWSVPRRDGEFLHFMVKATRAKHVLEIGTSQGFSAIWMGLAVEETGGRLTTIEIDKERNDLARKNVAEAGLAERITLIRGDAHVEVTRLAGPFDFVFFDADKEGQVDYFNKLFPKKLAPGGILAVHNAIRQAGSMKDYLDLVRKHQDLDTVLVSATMDDGFCLSCRHRV